MCISNNVAKLAATLPLIALAIHSNPAAAQSRKNGTASAAPGWLSPSDHRSTGNAPPPPDGGQGRPGGPDGGGPGGPGGPGRGFGGPPPLTLAHIPIALLISELKLTADQKSRIEKLQASARPPRPGGPPPGMSGMPGNPGMPGQPPQSISQNPGPGPMPGQRPPMRDTLTNQQIEALLTPAQRSALPSLLKQAQSLRYAGIPLELYPTLNLTPAQKTQIFSATPLTNTGDRQKDDATHRARFEKTLALLTPPQRQALEAFRKSHPRPFPGGPGGPGGMSSNFGPPSQGNNFSGDGPPR